MTKSKSKKQYRKINRILSVGISLALLIGFVYVYYLSYIKYIDSKKEITETHFSEIVTAGKALVLNHIDNITEETGYTAEILSLAGDSKENLGSLFEKQIINTKADAGLLISGDGSVIYGNPEHCSLFLAATEYVLESGGSAVSDMVECSDGIKRYGAVTSFTMEDGSKAVVMLLYPQTVLNDLIDSSILSDHGRLCIADSKGGFVAQQSLPAPWVEEGAYLVERQDRLLSVSSKPDGKEYAVYSKSLGINDWFIVYAMPKEVLFAQEQVGSNRIHIFGTVCLIFGLLMIGMGIYKNYVRSYRLNLFKKKFKIATSQSARAAFEYDKRTDRLSLISECKHICLPKPYISLAELSNLVHPADRAAYGQSVIELRRDGTTLATLRLSHFAGTDAYRWYHVTATRLTDRGEGKALTIGTVEDIDEREQERLFLAEKATTDCLTGLCNRSETEKIINERLQKLEDNEHSAFAIIDLDDFKNINDEYGHDCGDKALIFFSDKLKSTFRFGDVIGRLGGDEFVVYMTLTSDKKVVERRIQELMESLKTKRCSDDFKMPEVTCSVGCCIASKGDTFDVLYKRADSALYKSKTKGKGLATIA